jgi:hypothetical protein
MDINQRFGFNPYCGAYQHQQSQDGWILSYG